MNNKILYFLFIFVVAMLSGCSSIQGQWYFAHVRKAQSALGEFPPPLQFDSIKFGKSNIVHLQSSLKEWSFKGTFTLAKANLTYRFRPPEMEDSVEHKLKYSLEGVGETLILTHGETEYVYYRPEKFYSNDIAGAWSLRVDDQSEVMHLSEDGNYLMEESKIIGHYRLWPSRYGKVMTSIIFVPGHGECMVICKYDKRGSQLTLTPIEYDGLMKESAVTWELK